jgi:hypothetical protein
MNGKQQTLTTKGLVITSLVAASASFGAIVAAPLSAKAQNSPVTPSPSSPVGTTTTVLDFSNLLGGTETSTTTTTTTTTTTQEGTTTTTTSETTSTTEVSSTQETTQVSTSEQTSGSTTTEISTEAPDGPMPISTGLEATSSVTAETTTSTETVAVVISLSQQYATATGMDAAFISELARLLGIDSDILVATLIFDRARGLQGNKQAAMQAFINALTRAGVFEIGAFNNEAFAQLFGSYATAEELAAVFNGLSDIRIRFLAQASKFFANKGFRFRLARKNISFAQFFVYKYTGTRAIGFPAARGSNNRRDED